MLHWFNSQKRKGAHLTDLYHLPFIRNHSHVTQPEMEIHMPSSKRHGMKIKLIFDIQRRLNLNCSMQMELPSRLEHQMTRKGIQCVHLLQKKPRYLGHSQPKKIIDIFNLKKPLNQPSQPKEKPSYKWETSWGAKDPSKNEINPKQTKYQAFSIENYLKHLLKVTTHLSMTFICIYLTVAITVTVTVCNQLLVLYDSGKYANI